jgi:cob(I)alamin adenosyltransferase
MTKIYTKTGDSGFTSLFTGERVPKDDPIIEAIGTVDECNSAIGIALSFIPKDETFNEIRLQLETIQHALFDLGAALATPRTRASESKVNKTRFDHSATEKLERWMDEMDAKLPPLHAFILPGGHPTSSFLQLARSICRRSERLIVPLNIHAEVSDHVMIYLNRLSDYLFVVARYLNLLTHTPETKWQQHKD